MQKSINLCFLSNFLVGVPMAFNHRLCHTKKLCCGLGGPTTKFGPGAGFSRRKEGGRPDLNAHTHTLSLSSLPRVVVVVVLKSEPTRILEMAVC